MTKACRYIHADLKQVSRSAGALAFTYSYFEILVETVGRPHPFMMMWISDSEAKFRFFGASRRANWVVLPGRE